MALRADWRASFTASYLCDLLNRLTPPGAPCSILFDWSDQTLDFLASQGTSATVLNWSELKLLKHLGVAPQLTSCITCGTKTFPTDRPTCFAIARGGLQCSSCAKGNDGPTLPLAPDILGMLRGWESTDTPAMAKRTLCTPKQSESANRLLDAFIHYHLQSSLARDIALGLIAKG
jgi:DNA repair protein RecO